MPVQEFLFTVDPRTDKNLSSINEQLRSLTNREDPLTLDNFISFDVIGYSGLRSVVIRVTMEVNAFYARTTFPVNGAAFSQTAAPQAIKLVFNSKVDEGSITGTSIKYNGTNVAASNITLESDGYTLSVDTSGLSYNALQTHTIELISLKDRKGNGLSKQDVFSYVVGTSGSATSDRGNPEPYTYHDKVGDFKVTSFVIDRYAKIADKITEYLKTNNIDRDSVIAQDILNVNEHTLEVYILYFSDLFPSVIRTFPQEGALVSSDGVPTEAVITFSQPTHINITETNNITIGGVDISANATLSDDKKTVKVNIGSISAGNHFIKINNVYNELGRVRPNPPIAIGFTAGDIADNGGSGGGGGGDAITGIALPDGGIQIDGVNNPLITMGGGDAFISVSGVSASEIAINFDETQITFPTETDPIFTTSDAAGITNTDITEWDSAYTHSQLSASNPHGVSIGNINGGTFANLDAAVTDADITKSGDNISNFVNDVPYLTAHPDINSATTGTTTNSDPDFIQNVELDSNGHVVGITAASITPGSIGAASSTHSHLIGDLPTKDEDNLASDSDQHLPTQQSVKAYVDGKVQTDVPAGAVFTDTVYTAFDTDFAAKSTDDLSEGSTNLYFTDGRARLVSIENLVEDLTPQLGGDLDANGKDIDMGINIITDTKVGQWDTAYTHSQISAANPHGVTPGIIGAEPTISSGNTTQYYRGDKSFQTLNVGAVDGLQDALDAKASSTHSHTVDDLPTTTSTGLGSSNALIPTQNAVKVYVDNNIYTNTDVDNHLNQSNPTPGYVLSWTDGDYAWVEDSDTIYTLPAADGTSLGGVKDGGDVTISAGAITVNDDSITFAKMQNISADTVIGRRTDGGNPTELDAADIRALINIAAGTTEIEDGATADQTAGEIKTAYESNPDTNAFTDTFSNKLAGIEATADVTDAINVAAAGAVMDSDFAASGLMKRTASGSYTIVTDNSDSWLTAETNDLSVAVTWANVPDANITESSVTQHSTALELVIDHDNLVGFVVNEHINWTASSAGTIHVSNIPGATTTTPGLMSGNEKEKLSYITITQAVDLDAIETDVTNINSHTAETGIHFTQSQISIPLSQITDNGALAALSTVGTTQIDDESVTFPKLEHIAQNTIIGRNAAGDGDPTALTATEVRSLLNVADGAEENVKSDWNETNAASDAFIQNKPTVITTGEQTKLSYITITQAVNLDAVESGVDNIEGSLQSGTSAGIKYLASGDSSSFYAFLQHDGFSDYAADEHFTQSQIDIPMSQINDAGGLATLSSVNGDTIDNNSVGLTELLDLTPSSVIGRISAGSGDPEVLDAGNIRDIINVEDGADVTDATNVAAAGAIMDNDFADNGLMKRTGAGTYGAAVEDIDYQSVPSEGAFADGDKDKLDGVESGADVTDFNNVNAAGAVMISDTNLSTYDFFLDQDDMFDNDPQKVASQQSIKAYVDANAGGTTFLGLTDTPSSISEDSLLLGNSTNNGLTELVHPVGISAGRSASLLFDGDTQSVLWKAQGGSSFFVTDTTSEQTVSGDIVLASNKTLTLDYTTAAGNTAINKTILVNHVDSEILTATGALYTTLSNEIDTDIAAINLNDLNDVTISSVADGQVLKYSSSSSKWINDTDATGSGGGGGGSTDLGPAEAFAWFVS